MPADEVLKMRGRAKADILGPTRRIGKDDEGPVAEWDYADIVVTLHRRGGRYRVREVRAQEYQEAEVQGE